MRAADALAAHVRELKLEAQNAAPEPAAGRRRCAATPTPRRCRTCFAARQWWQPYRNEFKVYAVAFESDKLDVLEGMKTAEFAVRSPHPRGARAQASRWRRSSWARAGRTQRRRPWRRSPDRPIARRAGARQADRRRRRCASWPTRRAARVLLSPTASAPVIESRRGGRTRAAARGRRCRDSSGPLYAAPRTAPGPPLSARSPPGCGCGPSRAAPSAAHDADTPPAVDQDAIWVWARWRALPFALFFGLRAAGGAGRHAADDGRASDPSAPTAGTVAAGVPGILGADLSPGAHRRRGPPRAGTAPQAAAPSPGRRRCTPAPTTPAAEPAATAAQRDHLRTLPRCSTGWAKAAWRRSTRRSRSAPRASAARSSSSACAPSCRASRAVVAQFIDEANLGSTLVHSNIIPVFDFGKVGDEYFLAQEYILGRDLGPHRRSASIERLRTRCATGSCCTSRTRR